MSLVPPKPSPLHPGYRLGRYELLCPVAQGGMAAVWLARLHGAHGFEKLVAVKTILPEHASDERFHKMFLDEAKLASLIDHLHVAHVLDLGEEDEVLFLAMEWVDGDSLSRLYKSMEKRGRSLPIGVVLRVRADVCGGLHAAHELKDLTGNPLNVVHRDVSPHNILVTNQGVAKLIDFGIAKARDRIAEETNAGLIKGKLQYMPPEQALGKPVDRRADVFAVGATRYYLLSNRPAYDGPNQLAILHVLTSGRPPLPLPNRVPGAVERVIMKALAHKADDRYASCAELQAALEEAMRAADCYTTANDVGRFLAEHFGDRIENRRKAIELALDAAGDRQKLEALLRPPQDATGGVLVGGAYLRVLSPGSMSGEKRLDAASSGKMVAGSERIEVQTGKLLGRDERGIPTLAEQVMAASAPTAPVVREIELERSPREGMGAMANEIDLAGIEREDAPTRIAKVGTGPASSSYVPLGSALSELPTGSHTTASTVRSVDDRASGEGSGVLKWVLGAVAVVVVAGGLLELTSHGAFFRNAVLDRVRAEEYAQIERDAVDQAKSALAHDTADRASAAVSALDAAVAKAPRHAPLLAWASWASFAADLRFGRDLDRHARASSLLDKIPQGPRKTLAIAVRDLAVGEAAKARVALDGLVKSEPKDVDVLLALGEAQLATQSPDEAAKTFDRAIEIERTPRTVFARIRALVTTDVARARAEATRLAKEAEDHVGARLVLARLAWADGDAGAAERWLSEIAKVPAATGAREKSEAASLRGFVLLSRGDVAGARKSFDESVAAAKGATSPQTELGLGDVELASGKASAAIAHYRAALDGDASLWRAQIGIARAQIALGNHVDAMATLAAIKAPEAAAEVATWSDVASGKTKPPGK